MPSVQTHPAEPLRKYHRLVLHVEAQLSPSCLAPQPFGALFPREIQQAEAGSLSRQHRPSPPIQKVLKGCGPMAAVRRAIRNHSYPEAMRRCERLPDGARAEQQHSREIESVHSTWQAIRAARDTAIMRVSRPLRRVLARAPGGDKLLAIVFPVGSVGAAASQRRPDFCPCSPNSDVEMYSR